MAVEAELLGQLGSMGSTLVYGLFFVLVGGGVIAAIWYFKTQVVGFPYKVTLEERRGDQLVTSIHSGRFEEETTEKGGKRKVFVIKGFKYSLPMINFAHIQPDNSIRIYRAGQSEFRPMLVNVKDKIAEEDGEKRTEIGWKPLVDPSWERAWADTVERVVIMRAEHDWLKEYAWVVPLGVMIIFMLIVVVATLNGLNEVVSEMKNLASSMHSMNTAPATTSSPKTEQGPPVIFAVG